MSPALKQRGDKTLKINPNMCRKNFLLICIHFLQKNYDFKHKFIKGINFGFTGKWSRPFIKETQLHVD